MSRGRVLIIGGGIVGLATARALARTDGVSVTVVEKEKRVGLHQSSHNSGVLHAGLAYKPGSAKARLATRGIQMMTRFCAERGIAHQICGKLVVATENSQLPALSHLSEQGTENGLRDLRLLSPEQAREIEPHVRCVGALHVPEEGIVDFPAVCRALLDDLRASGVEVSTGAEVLRTFRDGTSWLVETTAGEYRTSFLVGCAGLHADRVMEMTGQKSPIRIVPFRGEYHRLADRAEALVRNLIYPVADPRFPFLGVHLTRRITGGVEAGPNAVLAFAREGYRRTDLDLRELAGAVLFPGLRRFVLEYRDMVRREIVQSLSKRRLLRALQQLVPDLGMEDLRAGSVGVRAQAMLPTGRLISDFSWVEGPGALHVLNAPSPAATASLAIGQEIASRVLSRIGILSPDSPPS